MSPHTNYVCHVPDYATTQNDEPEQPNLLSMGLKGRARGPFPRRERQPRWINNLLRRKHRDDDDDDPPPVPVLSRRPPGGLPPRGQEEPLLFDLAA